MEKNTQRRSSCHTKTPPQTKKDGEKFEGFLILVRNQTASKRGEERSVAAAESPASCQKSGSNPQSEDKTSFSLWLNHR